MRNLNGFLSKFEKQIRALEMAYHDALCKIPLRAWSWGGGTALAIYHLRHRISFDIDIFIPDPQHFAFLSPKWFIEDTKNFSHNYQELAHHIRLTTHSEIKIDFLLAPYLISALISAPSKNTLLETGFDFYVDTPEEIIAKKLRHRFREVRSRDVFDLAAALQKDGNLLRKIMKSGAIPLDQFAEWKTLVECMDMERYKQDMEKMSPENMTDMILNTKEIILDALENLRLDITAD